MSPVLSAHRSGPQGAPHPSRGALMAANRIVVKAGTSIISNSKGYPCLSRMGAVVEQCAWLNKMGKEVILVSSGAVGVGRQVPEGRGHHHYDSAAAAAGQLPLSSIYETLFSYCDVVTSQLSGTESDFRTPERRMNLSHSTSTMLKLGVVPILIENDAVSGNEGYEVDGMFSDNDGLAALVATEMKANLLILLTDVAGVYNKHPNEPGAQIFHEFHPKHKLTIGEKSTNGRGGMEAKIRAANNAIAGGVESVVIASGLHMFTIEQIVCGERVGTLFRKHLECIYDTTVGPGEGVGGVDSLAVRQAEGARAGGRKLCALPSEDRAAILRKVAEALLSKTAEILAANRKDLQAAKANNISAALLNRLKLTEEKIKVLAHGISSLAKVEEPLGRCMKDLQGEGFDLKQITAPIGVLLIVLESQPDSTADRVPGDSIRERAAAQGGQGSRAL